MQLKRFFTALFSIAMFFSCVDDGLEDDFGNKGNEGDDGAISVAAYLSDDYSDADGKGTPITTGIAVTSLGLFTNLRDEGDNVDTETTQTEIHNSEVFRNIYGTLEFREISYWPVLGENQKLGFIAYSPFTDVTTTTTTDSEGVSTTTISGTTTSSGLTNPESINMQNFTIDYKVPTNVADQPDLLVSYPVEQSGGAVSLVFNHVLATVAFNVKGDGVQPVKCIEITNLASEATLNATYDYSGGEYLPNYDWEFDTLEDGTTPINTTSFTIGLADYGYDGSLEEIYPTDELTCINSASGYLMMIPQLVSAATEIIVTFTDNSSRSLRFFDTQNWVAGGFYSYNINIDFEGEVIDLSDITTVNTLVNNPTATTLETANCYILNPPVYTKEQEAETEAAIAAAQNDVIYFTRAGEDETVEDETVEDDDADASASATGYGALYYIPITSQMKEYYGTCMGGSVPEHLNWSPVVLWYDCEKEPTSEGIIIKRVDATESGEERFSVYIPYKYSNLGNIVVAVKSDKGAIIWSWHLWVTDYNPYYDKTLSYTAAATGEKKAYTVDVEGGELHHYADNQTAVYTTAVPYYWSNVNYYLYRLIMDRNLGSMNNDGGSYDDNQYTSGLFYQYARKDPFPRGAASLDYYSPDDRTYTLGSVIGTSQVSSFTTAVENPTVYYNKGEGADYNNTATYIYAHSWYAYTDYTYVWGDARYTTTGAGEYNKSIFDPSPIGFMMPTINVWNDFNTSTSSSEVTVTSDAKGILYKDDTYTSSTSEYITAQYPMSGYISGAGVLTTNGVSGLWTSTSYRYLHSTSYSHYQYSWAQCMYFNSNITQTTSGAVTAASRTRGYNVRPIQRWYEGVQGAKIITTE